MNYLNSSTPISYRAEASDLNSRELAAELFWIGDAVYFGGSIGDYARARSDRLRHALYRLECGTAVAR